VHAVVVLVPVAALGAVTVAISPPARRHYGWLVVCLAAVATTSIPLATETGEGLEHNLARNTAVEAHARLGDQLLPFAGGLLAALVVLVLLERRPRRWSRQAEDPAPRHRPVDVAEEVTADRRVRIATVVLAGVVVVLAVVSVVQVVRIGDSGARAAWGSVQYVQQRGRG
jgi:hypothetical protein